MSRSNHVHADSHETAVDKECEVFVSRIPSHFAEDSVRRLLELHVGSVVTVGLKYNDEDEDDQGQRDPNQDSAGHKGYAFAQFETAQLAESGIALGKIRGGRTASSTKQHTLYLSATNNDDEATTSKPCFLWKNRSCPYGDECKFSHEGDGACAPKPDKKAEPRRRKCWDYKKGKCSLGSGCPFSHDFEVVKPSEEKMKQRPKHEKDCITWKTKGKCKKKGEKCPYRHDEAVREKLLKKRSNDKTKAGAPYKRQQPLSVRVFGLNYDSKEEDVRKFLEPCGTIQSMTFPTFEDSGRSKGFCLVMFTSPKAVEKAILLHETELHGRWLSIQAGQMYLDQWEEQRLPPSPATTKRQRR